MTNTPMTKEALEQEYAKYFNALDTVYQNDLELHKLLHQWNYKGFRAGYEASQLQQASVIAELVEALHQIDDMNTCAGIERIIEQALAKVKGK